MKIALAQYPIIKHKDLESWRVYVENWIKNAKGAQLLVFPEYGSIELLSFDEYTDDLKQQILNISLYLEDFKTLFSHLAKKYNLYILAPSIPVKVSDKFINRAYFFNPLGEHAYQDKLIMTRFEDEDWCISQGELELFVFNTRLGKIGINICFDSEFPQLAFELAKAGVELLLVPSCTETDWGLSRIHVGCRARALENQFYVAVSSTVGDSFSTIVDYNTGQAAVFTPADDGFPSNGIEAIGTKNEPAWVVSELDFDKIKEVRANGQALNFKNTLKLMNSNSKFLVKTIEF